MLASTLFGYSKDWFNDQKVIIRVIHAPNDLLISFDLRGHNFRVDVEFSTYYHGHSQKQNFEPKGFFQTFFKKYH